MNKLIKIEDKLEEKVTNLEDKLKKVEDDFDQTMSRLDMKQNNGKLTESDLYKAIEALRKHHEGEDTITDEIIKVERKLGKYKEKSE